MNRVSIASREKLDPVPRALGPVCLGKKPARMHPSQHQRSQLVGFLMKRVEKTNTVIHHY
eukprot:COSAG04_NODE_185_length_21024_cov_49.557276_18_plen_60_part_00